jgi:hypothetical protein
MPGPRSLSELSKMKIFDAHKWLRINDLLVIRGKETPQNTGFVITRTGS